MRRPQRLMRLYPRRWRDRYQDEFMALMEDINADRRLTRGLGFDLICGAGRPHLSERRRRAEKPSTGLRTGARDALVVSSILAVVVLVTNGIVPSTGSDQGAPVAGGYFAVAAVLVAIGV